MIYPSVSIEKSLWNKGYKFIAGIDEVGRGAWAGPLVAGAVVLPIGFAIPKGLADSKLVAAKTRKKLSKIITERATTFALVQIKPAVIDRLGLSKATSLAFRKLVKKLNPTPDYCLIDAFHIKYFPSKQMAIKGGDKVCASIAAASIIAKVHRDDLMIKLNQKFPEYGFHKNKGYGTKIHQQAIKKFGLSKIHRTSYDLSAYLNG